MKAMYRKHLRNAALATLVGCLAIGTAAADPILTATDPNGSTPYAGSSSVPVPTNNDLGEVDRNTSLLVGMQLQTTGAGSVTYTYLGKEAGYTNLFKINVSGCEMSTATATIGVSSCTVMMDQAGLLDFGFTTSGGGTPASIFNGDDFDLFSAMTFALQRIDDLTWLILLDDSGGNPNDKDFDDMGLRVVFTPHSVPEPGTLALLGLGIVGLGMIRRRNAA